MERKLTELESTALTHFNLQYAESEEEGAGWFAYTDMFDLHPDYPGSSCECLHNVVEWYKAARESKQWANRSSSS